jgi:hypothetical protein
MPSFSDHGLFLRQWHWPPPRWYNGFSPQERVRGWQALWWLIDNGHIPHPDICSITGQKRREPGENQRASSNLAGQQGGETTAFAYHNENYYAPFELYPISREAHRLLHRRFYDPKPWQALVEEHSRTGEEWFALLKPYPIDLASELRERHGAGITDILKTAIAKVTGAASSCDKIEAGEDRPGSPSVRSN